MGKGEREGRRESSNDTYFERDLGEALWTADVETIDLNSKIIFSLCIFFPGIELPSLVYVVAAGETPVGRGER